MFWVCKNGGTVTMKQAYRFKVALKHRRRLWRRIEIEGVQTLGDLDCTKREAFIYYLWDHLSEFFWGRVWQSKGLGEIYPGGGGSGAKKRIDSLGLSEGDKLEYVYDFGDDSQHIVTLEKVIEAKETAKHPRIISQNKPKYSYCEVCEKLGKKTIATWVCIECSNETQRDVLVCEDCLMKEHDDHDAEEMLY